MQLVQVKAAFLEAGDMDGLLLCSAVTQSLFGPDGQRPIVKSQGSGDWASGIRRYARWEGGSHGLVQLMNKCPKAESEERSVRKSGPKLLEMRPTCQVFVYLLHQFIYDTKVLVVNLSPVHLRSVQNFSRQKIWRS